jgi:hypothetical protein
MSRSRRKRARVVLWMLRDDGFMDEERRRTDASLSRLREAQELGQVARELGWGKRGRQCP